MDEIALIMPLAVSLAVGLLIGLERGWQTRVAAEGQRVAGVRTYGLIGLLGGFSGLLSKDTDLAVVGYGLVGVAIVLVASYVVSAARRGDIGVTSIIAGLLTFALGAAATRGHVVEAAMASVVTALLLGYKSLLHSWVNALESDELHATLKLLAISVIILPILPNHGYGPWNALNPFEIWWMVVLISAISFVGYFAMKIAGAGNGALLTGLLAGLASSTALTLHFARLARGRPGTATILASGILIACGTMFPRMLLVASVVHAPIFHSLAVPALTMSAVVYASAGLLWWHGERSPKDHEKTQLRNPLELRSAIFFGVLLAIVLMAAKAIETAYGEAGMIALASVAGLSDVDAITLALAKMSQSELGIDVAVFLVVLASVVNGATKGGMALTIGGLPLGLRVATPLAIAGILGMLIAWPAGGLGAFDLTGP